MQNLSSYLSTRKTQIGFFSEQEDLEEIQKRSLFLNQLTSALFNDQVDNQENLLAEEKIKVFKGVFSKNLYSLLSELRGVIRQESNHLEIEEGENYLKFT